jgi:hypothetical protein
MTVVKLRPALAEQSVSGAVDCTSAILGFVLVAITRSKQTPACSLQ